MRKNKLLSGVLSAVMAAALIPAMPADEISAEESLSGGSEFYTMPEDKSEPILRDGWEQQPVSVTIENEKVGEETVEKKYFDLTLTSINDEFSNFSWDDLAKLGNFALEFTVTTERGIVFTESKVGTVVHDTDNSQIWIADNCEINDGVGQFIGVGSNFVQRDYDKGQFNIRFVLPESYYGIYPQGSTEKITISYAIYKAEKATSKWNYDSTMSSQNIKPADLASEAGIAADTVEKIDFYSNVPISVEYPSTEGRKEVKGCRVSLSDINFSSTDDLTISTNPSDGGFVPVNWKVYQKVVLSVNKQFTPLENGKYSQRGIVEIKAPEVFALDHVEITFQYGNYSKTISTTKLYTSINADKVNRRTAGGYFFAIVTLWDIPDDIVPYVDKNGDPAGLDVTYKLVEKSEGNE